MDKTGGVLKFIKFFVLKTGYKFKPDSCVNQTMFKMSTVIFKKVPPTSNVCISGYNFTHKRSVYNVIEFNCKYIIT